MVVTKYFNDYKELVANIPQIKESHKRFYIFWIELFFDYLKKNNNTEKKFSESEKLTNFTQYLSKNNKYQDWQINQAIDAINLLYSLTKNIGTNELISLDSIIEQT